MFGPPTQYDEYKKKFEDKMSLLNHDRYVFGPMTVVHTEIVNQNTVKKKKKINGHASNINKQIDNSKVPELAKKSISEIT